MPPCVNVNPKISNQELLTSRVPLPPSWGHSWLFRLVDFLLLIPLAFSSRESLGLPTSSSLGLVLGIGLLDTGAFVASALGFVTGQVAVVSVLASLSSAVTVVLTAIFLRERLHLIQWLLIGMLLAEVMLTHVERIGCIQSIGTIPHASTSPLERRSCGILLS